MSQFELLSRFDYPAEDYEAAKSIYLNAVKALEQGRNDASLTKSLLDKIEYLDSVKNVQKLTGLNSLTLKLNVGEKLPDTVNIKVGGASEAVPVIWESIPADRLTKSGAFTVRGRIEGAPCPVTVAVSVVGKSSAALRSLVKDYGNIDTSLYTAESVDAFNKALSEAEIVLSDSEATQEQIDSAKFALKTAKYGLMLPIYESLSLKEKPPVQENPEQPNPPISESPDHTPITPDTDKPESLSVGVIAAIVIGAAALIGALIGFIRKKK